MTGRSRALEGIAEVGTGYSFRGAAEAGGCSEALLIQIKDIQEGPLTSCASLPYANVELSKVTRSLKEGDLLVPLRGERHAAMLFCKGAETRPVVTTNQVAVITPDREQVMPDFLLWYLNSEEFRAVVSRLKSGVTILALTVSTLKKMRIALPSLERQQEVVKIHQNWLEQETTLREAMDNGKALAEVACFRKCVENS